MKPTTKIGLAGAAAVAAAVIVHVLTTVAYEPPKPDGFSYCTDPAYYVANYEVPQTSVPGCPEAGPCAVYLEVYQGTPGDHSQFGGDHAWIVEDVRHRYAIIGQGAGAHGYPKPPADASYALPVWTDCFINHKSPAPPHLPTSGNYHCDGTISTPSGETRYTDLTLAQLAIKNPPQWRAYKSKYFCSVATPTETPTEIPTITPAPVCPTCVPKVVTVVVTASPSPHFGPAPSRTQTPDTRIPTRLGHASDIHTTINKTPVAFDCPALWTEWKTMVGGRWVLPRARKGKR
jgi:hypothetical protein